MSTATMDKAGDRDSSIMEGTEPAGAPVDAATREKARAERLRLLVQPVVAVLLAGGALVWAFGFVDLTATQKATINVGYIAQLTGQHLWITFLVTAIILLVAVPLGTLITRPAFRWMSPFFIGIANVGASAPAIGLLVLYYLAVSSGSGWTSWLPGGSTIPVGPVVFTGVTWAGVLPIAFYALLPVLRNTILGYQEVEATLIDAGRGQGMSAAGVLRRVEFPLAVPYILAGLRTSLVLAVGTATLCFLVGSGGLGILIDTGYKLSDIVTLVVGAVLAVALALLVDWLGALAEQFIGPKGLR